MRTALDRLNWRAGAFALAVAVGFLFAVTFVFEGVESPPLQATMVAVLSGVCGAIVVYGVWREWWRSCLLWVGLSTLAIAGLYVWVFLALSSIDLR